MSIVRQSVCFGIVLLSFVITALPLTAGSLNLSGVPGTIRYRVEHSEQLSGDWIETEVNTPGNTAKQVFRANRAAWISLFFRHSATNNTHYVEVFVGADDDIEMSFEWNPGINEDRLSVAYARHPALDYQSAYDNFTFDKPANHAMEIAYLKQVELTGVEADLNRIVTQWVDEQLDLLTSTLTTPAEAQPYRTRMTWRMLQALCGRIYDGELLPKLSQSRRDSLVYQAMSHPPAYAENFRGRFWRGYMSVRAQLGTAIRPSFGGTGLPASVMDRSGKPGDNIRPLFANLLVYAEEAPFEYLYASQLQQQLDIFASDPGRFDREVAYFRCLFPESPYLQTLLN